MRQRTTEYQMATCAPITTSSLLGTYGLYDSTKPGCSSANAAKFMIGKPLFYGKNEGNNQPMFAVLDYENFKIARTGMVVSTCTAAVLGIATIVLAIKCSKK